MRFLVFFLLLVPVKTASHEHKSEGSHKDTKTEKELTKALKEAVKANSEFAINFFKHVTSVASEDKGSPPKNVILSPVSISSAFSMLSLGARSKTHQEIWAGLSLNITHCSEGNVHQAFSNLLQASNGPRSSLQVNIGNAIFLDNKLTLLKSFEGDVRQHYRAEIRKTNFFDSQEAAREINEYVKNKTDGKIEELVKDLPANAKMVLINYVLFKGEWREPFHPLHTSFGKFYVDSNTTMDVPMMHRIGHYNFLYDKKLSCTVVDLPYKDNASMIIAIAKPGKIHKLEQAMSAETIQQWKISFRKAFIELSLPKFSISSTINLADSLHERGIRTAFTDAADFSGITEEDSLKVGKAIHKAALDVDEKGTEAASTSGLENVPMALFLRIKFNHPFVSLIYEQNTDSILFMATVMNPAQK